MKVSYVTTGNDSIASFRYRTLSPAKELRELGHQTHIENKARPDADIVVFSKHWQYNDWSYAYFCSLRGQKVVFDVCDDHFDSKHADHYKRMCDVATAVTCNSEVMAEVIQKHTGRVAAVVKDPVLTQRKLYQKRDASLLWYGQMANIQSLFTVYTEYVKVPLEVVVPGPFEPPEYMREDQVRWTKWFPNVIESAATRNTIALLPYRTDRKAKSANRVLEALNSGLYVLTDPLPAVEDLERFGIWYLDEGLQEGVKYYEENDLTGEMASAQRLIDLYYTPKAIAEDWQRVFAAI
jgi:hypothetical protein